MFRNYLKTALRNLWKSKGFTVINILGLTIGLATCLLIALFVKDELSFDRFNQKADRIYRVNIKAHINGTSSIDVASCAPLGFTMVKDYPEIENAVRLQGETTITVRKGSETLNEKYAGYADSTLFDVFSFPLIEGDPETALTQPHTVVISESTAKKYFNRTDVIGKTMYINNTADYKITGVIRDMPAQSSFHFNFILPMADIADSRSDKWLSNSYVTFLLVRPKTTQQQVDKYLKQATLKYAEPQLENLTHSSFADLAKKGDYYEYYTIPLTKIHLYSNFTNEIEPTGNIQYLYIFVVIAIFILLVACVNFMNLSTARSAGRAKEVGIRKVLGSLRINLITQFLTEAMITSFVAMLLAVLLAILLLPYFNQLSGKTISYSALFSRWMIPALLFTSTIVGLLAGSYPAFFLSGFRPVVVLKGALASGFKSGWLRNGLVVFQFVTAILLIVGTIVIYSQLNYIRHKKLGYDRDHVLVLQNTYLLGSHAVAFKNEVLKMPGVTAGTMSGSLPTDRIFNNNAFSKDASMNASQAVLLNNWNVDADLIPALGMTMAAGRNFSPQMPTDTSAVIINKTAAKMLGYADPLNKKLYQYGSGNHPPTVYTIIGVVNDFNAGSLHFKTQPVLFNLATDNNDMAFRIHTRDIPGLISIVKNKYHAMAGMAGQPFVYSFMDDDFNRLYKADQQTGRIFISFALLSILIACLGLFGLVTYAAEQRTKEIGIRKVLGASVRGIVALLSRDFLKLVFIAIIIGSPLAWIGMNKWLQNFAYRIHIGWWMFVAAGVLAMLIAMITVSWQAVRAAVANPVESLRME